MESKREPARSDAVACAATDSASDGKGRFIASVLALTASAALLVWAFANARL